MACTRYPERMIAAPAILLSALAMTLIVGVRYLISSGGFALATRIKHPGLYRGLEPQMRREIGWSLASAAIYGIPAGIVAWGWQEHGWTRIYTDIDAFPLWYLPVSLLCYLLIHDTWFYWTHRWMHRPALFRIAHAVHHDSRPPTAWAAMSFHPIEALTGAVVIPALVFLIPIHVAVLGLVLAAIGKGLGIGGQADEDLSLAVAQPGDADVNARGRCARGGQHRQSGQAPDRCRTPCPRSGNKAHNSPGKRRDAAGGGSRLSASALPVHEQAHAGTFPSPYDCRPP